MSAGAIPAPGVVVVGTVGAPFGVKGWMHVKSHTEPAENILAYRPWQARAESRGDWREVDAEARTHQGGFVARFDGVADRDEAALWRGARIGVHADALPPPNGDEYYWRDLIGLRAFTCDNDELGQVARVFSTPAHDVLVLESDVGERLVPFVRRIVHAVDAQGGRIVLDWQRDWL